MKYTVLENNRIASKGYAMLSKDAKFTPFEFTRHAVGDNDVLIKILYAGICHSDIHTAKSEWGEATYPCVPGHEIAGEVLAVGKNVSKFKVGDYAGVGCMVNSCGECEACKNSQEQFCENSKTVFTYNSKDVFHDNENTYGGYSNNIVVNENFAICVPKDAALDKVAPLLCAGITTYSPLKFSKVKQGSNIAVAGFGGLGMMAVKYAVKMGARVSVFARNENKKADALAMGASCFYTSTDKSEVKQSFDFIISTIPTFYDPIVYLDLLKFGGEMAIVGLPPLKNEVNINIKDLVYKAGKKVYGSLIGGIAQTQEMLDFSLRHQIYPEIELITPQEIDKAYKNLTSGKAKFRYVIDMTKE
ncbi:NAD(P)-dependent alcohol dehydrogenase [Campylobacter sp. VicNov18]|uniref:NAD(P)-dependent alcohol dehydrogenase n=1 Tax=Campylobacter bilis TaxID=2691918 RepID=UPI00130E63CA|nr:NAD(P)-dependent alcohol dehydrogenase [Campylobacter bilis]MPV63910.1 alcohol dehydrogenase catalytic domain-containing protein [Campylobacter hepaticus]MBM0637411.1 alcohol dehydrogenase catalytic domain-containing protein [Campylobacter bilis]MCC8278132.1 NAD(P)-dependent alcohol dehydrogenase [Campylobacter bilis]MCC8299636.1 NAD(P)-dependent alcohol dehydrogenase [Campylobacter bilis]MCC8301041.1 NAD(P)-dependent alcohol dehydrogenase [Campylobacter bilis]